MKKFKILSFILALVFCFSLLSSTLLAASVYTNHTMRVNTNFYISETGVADVYTSYYGYEDVMTEAVIHITIKKRNLLFFWNEVTTHTLYSTDYDYSNVFSYQLEKKGTYKCEVEYIIYGTAGEADVLPFEDTRTY